MVAVILAAGQSRRFEGKKLLEMLQGRPMISHITELICSLAFEQRILVYSDEAVAEAACQSRETEGISPVFNSRAEEGISTSIRTALNTAIDTDGYIFFVGDQPFLDAHTVMMLQKAFYEKKGTIIVPVYGGKNGNPVIFARQWKNQLVSLKGDIGGRDIIRKNPEEVYKLTAANEHLGMDIDTRQEYFNACSGEREQ